MIVQAKHWVKTDLGWMEPGEEFIIDREDLDLYGDSVEVIPETDDDEQADPPVEDQPTQEDPVKAETVKKRGRKKQE